MATSFSGRMAWVDLIKGISVVLVVLMHAALLLPGLAGDSTVAGVWNDIGTLLEPLRMPVFFFVSGMLASSAVQRSWDSNRQRTWGMGYLYVLWTVILLGLTTLFLQQTPLEATTSLPGTLLFAASGYWYLYALLLFFVIAVVTRRLPPLLVVAAAAALNIFRPLTNDVLASVLDPIHPGSLAAMMTLNLVFFLVGVHYKKWGAWVAARANWPTMLLLGSALIAAGIFRLNTPELWEHTFLPLSIGWIVWAIMAAAIATRWVAPRELGSYLGARTLPIYVMQFPLLFLIPWGLQLYATGALEPAWVQALFPLAVTGFIVLVALVLHTWVQGKQLRYLFTAPEWALNPRAAVARARRDIPSADDVPAPTAELDLKPVR